MKPIPVFLAAWALAGCGAVVGSILGNSAGTRGLFAGAVVGGLAGVLASVAVAVRLEWLSAELRRSALIGGALGFGIAAPIAATNLHTPVTPVLVCALAGAGTLGGAWVKRRGRGAG